VALYGYDNDELTEIFTNKGYVENHGTRTDCSSISEKISIACVNLFCGYENEHTSDECVDCGSLAFAFEVLTDKNVIQALSAKQYTHHNCEYSAYE